MDSGHCFGCKVKGYRNQKMCYFECITQRNPNEVGYLFNEQKMQILNESWILPSNLLSAPGSSVVSRQLCCRSFPTGFTSFTLIHSERGKHPHWPWCAFHRVAHGIWESAENHWLTGEGEGQQSCFKINKWLSSMTCLYIIYNRCSWLSICKSKIRNVRPITLLKNHTWWASICSHFLLPVRHSIDTFSTAFTSYQMS